MAAEDPEKGRGYSVPTSSDVTTQLSIQMGYDLPPGDLIGLSSGPIGEFLRKLGKFVHDQDERMKNPPWLPAIERKLERIQQLNDDVAQLFLLAKRPQPSAQARRSDDLDPLEAGGGDDDEGSQHTRSSRDDNSHAPSSARSDDDDDEEEEDDDSSSRGRAGHSTRRGSKEKGRGKGGGGKGAIPKQGGANYVTHLDLEERLIKMRKHLKLSTEAKSLDAGEALAKLKTELERLSKHVDTKPKVKDVQSVRDTVVVQTKSLKAYVSERLTAMERDMASKSENSAASLEAWKSQITGGTVEKTDDLAKDVAALEEGLSELRDKTDDVQETLEDKLADMEVALSDKIEELEGQGAASTEAIGEIDMKIQMLQQGADDAEGKTDELQRAIDEVRAKVEGKEKENDSFKTTVLERLAAQEARLLALEERTEPLERRLTELENHVHGADERETSIQNTVMEMKVTVTKCDENLSQLLQVDFPNMANGFKEDISGSLSKVKQANELLAAQEGRLAALQEFQAKAEQEMSAIPERIDAVRTHAEEIHAVTKEHKSHLEKLQEQHSLHTKSIHSTVEGHVERIDKNAEEVRQHSAQNRKLLDAHAEKIDASVEEISQVKESTTENALAISNEADSRTASMARATAEQKKAVGLLLDEQKENVRRLCQDVADDVNMKFKSKDGRGVVLMSDAEQRVFLHSHAESLAEHCVRIEDEAEERGRPPDELDSALATEISTVSRDLAVYISEKADHEALEAMIRGPPDILEYVDDNVAQRRMNLILTFVSMIVGISEARGKGGFHREAARDLFANRVNRALESALTKFEQVLIVQNSRSMSKKLDVPKCMTCELPLVDAKRRMRMLAIDNGGVVRRGDYLATMGKTAVPGGSVRPSTSSQSLEKFNRNLPKSGTGRPATGSKFPIREATPMANGNDWKGPKSPEGNSGVSSTYIMRGGFRMPRPQMNEDLLSAMSAPRPLSPATGGGGSNDEDLTSWEGTAKYQIGPEN